MPAVQSSSVEQCLTRKGSEEPGVEFGTGEICLAGERQLTSYTSYTSRIDEGEFG